MAAFSWQALDSRGRLKKGVLEADSPKHLRQLLRGDGLNPVSFEEVRGNKQRNSGDRDSSSVVDRSLKPVDLSMFTRQIATLLRSKLPVEEALRILASQTTKKWQSHLITALRSKVAEGMSLAEAFRQYPRAFPDYYAATVAAGEQAGKLEEVLERLADYAEEANATRQKVILSLLYPVIVSIVAVTVIVILMVFVVPKMIQVFEHMDQQLPLLTRGMIATSTFLQQYGLFLLGAFVLLGIGFAFAYRRAAFRLRVHKLLLRVPMLSHLIRELNTARFLRTFAILLGSSVSATQAMVVASRVLASLPIREALMEAANRVREGTSISHAMTNTGYFSPMALNLVASGEASGNLPEMLERAGEGQERTLQSMIATAVGVMEPLMIVVMGGVVLMIVLAILMPIFDMNEMVN